MGKPPEQNTRYGRIIEEVNMGRILKVSGGKHFHRILKILKRLTE